MQCEFQEGTISLLSNSGKSTEDISIFVRTEGYIKNSLSSCFLQRSQIYRAATFSDSKTQTILCQMERKEALPR